MKSKVQQWFLTGVVFAFLSVLSFFQIDSYHADKWGLNGFYWIAGIVTGLVSVYSMWKAKKTQ